MAATTTVLSPLWSKKKCVTCALGQALQLPSISNIIAVLGRITDVTQLSKDKASKEAAQANVATREMVVDLLHFMTLDLLSFSPNPSHSCVAKLTLSLLGEVAADVRKGTADVRKGAAVVTRNMTDVSFGSYLAIYGYNLHLW